MDDHFLLQTKTSQALFQHCRDLPIFDYHCHLSAQTIYENRQPDSLAELWFSSDHYKWRAMRAHGVPENKITGDASDYDKFAAYAETLTQAPGNPLYHWTHLELQRYFGICEPLTDESCRRIWDQANDEIRSNDFSPRSLIQRSNVYGLCTTENPEADLTFHRRLSEEGFPVMVLPAFRPDPVVDILRPNWHSCISQLGRSAGITIDSWSGIKEALVRRMDVFAQNGCVASDHGLERFVWRRGNSARMEQIVRKALAGVPLQQEEAEVYQTELLLWLGQEYSARGWVMELHVNCLRSRNTRMVSLLGEATGFDTVADYPLAEPLSCYMDCLEQNNMLPKMILFSLNARDNEAVSALIGNYQNSLCASKIQMGTAWWFQDHRDGMEAQMRALANAGLLGHFIGMLTDSRSFLSYPRHEYFRRILCNLLGSWVEEGEFPADERLLNRLVSNICFYNAKNYFGV